MQDCRGVRSQGCKIAGVQGRKDARSQGWRTAGVQDRKGTILQEYKIVRVLDRRGARSQGRKVCSLSPSCFFIIQLSFQVFIQLDIAIRGTCLMGCLGNPQNSQFVRMQDRRGARSQGRKVYSLLPSCSFIIQLPFQVFIQLDIAIRGTCPMDRLGSPQNSQFSCAHITDIYPVKQHQDHHPAPVHQGISPVSLASPWSFLPLIQPKSLPIRHRRCQCRIRQIGTYINISSNLFS